MVLAQTLQAVRASSVAELCWLGPEGAPRVHGVVALPAAEGAVVAFTYADEPVARAVAAAGRVVLTLTETRSTGPGFTPLLVRGSTHLVEDASGEIFRRDLLVHELRRYPPSRLLADSPMLCREHWWYLPRLIVQIAVDDAEPLPTRPRPDGRLLAVAARGSLAVSLVRVPDERPDAERLALDAALPPGPAALFGQDASFPDLEQWSQWSFEGAWDGTHLNVRRAPARVGLEPRPTLRQRMRRERELERECRARIPRPGR
ncbi:hypothetical protein [Georgenia sp. AZ-5]|uniref:hypothetical protein n=1 Tax=Georgenia sp. AZ-5 TaxID=3367526 RepID=UPI003754FB98